MLSWAKRRHKLKAEVRWDKRQGTVSQQGGSNTLMMEFMWVGEILVSLQRKTKREGVGKQPCTAAGSDWKVPGAAACGVCAEDKAAMTVMCSREGGEMETRENVKSES